MRLCLYQPEIPQNTGTLLRLAACLGVGVDLIEPFGFVWSDKHLKRAGMDYMDKVDYKRHQSWEDFMETVGEGRVVLLSTKSSLPYTSFSFKKNDILMLGRESDGVPGSIESAISSRVLIPLQPGFRSLNVAMAGAMVLGEAIRQVNLRGETS